MYGLGYAPRKIRGKISRPITHPAKTEAIEEKKSNSRRMGHGKIDLPGTWTPEGYYIPPEHTGPRPWRQPGKEYKRKTAKTAREQVSKHGTSYDFGQED